VAPAVVVLQVVVQVVAHLGVHPEAPVAVHLQKDHLVVPVVVAPQVVVPAVAVLQVVAPAVVVLQVEAPVAVVLQVEAPVAVVLQVEAQVALPSEKVHLAD